MCVCLKDGDPNAGGSASQTTRAETWRTAREARLLAGARVCLRSWRPYVLRCWRMQGGEQLRRGVLCMGAKGNIFRRRCIYTDASPRSRNLHPIARKISIAETFTVPFRRHTISVYIFTKNNIRQMQFRLPIKMKISRTTNACVKYYRCTIVFNLETHMLYIRIGLLMIYKKSWLDYIFNLN